VKARRLGLWLQLLLAGGLLLAVWVLAVWVASRPALKGLIDLTPQQVNSVDPTTVAMLRELRAQQVKVEFHQFYPPFAGQPGDAWQAQEYQIRSRLRELTRLLLVRYQYLGGESVDVLAHDFYGDAPRTRAAAQRFDYRDVESDTLVVAVTMPGRPPRFRKLSLPLDLATIERPNPGAPGMQQQALPVLKRFLGEEQISSAIKTLLVEGTPIAYVLTGFSPDLQEGDTTPTGYSNLFAALRLAGFEVRPWAARAQATVPADASMVLVLEPRRNFTDAVADGLFAYVQRGGRVFLNYSYADVSDWNPDGGRFGELLGYALSEQPVYHMIQDVRSRTAGRGLSGDIAVTKLQLFVNREHPMTARIADAGTPLEVANARELRVRPGAPGAVRRMELLRTGNQGWLAMRGADGFPSLQAPQVPLQSYVVGMVMELDAQLPADAPTGTPKTGQVVVVSGAFCNNIGMPLFGELALNICNWLAQRRVLLDLKTPGYEARYLQIAPQQRDRIHGLLVWGVPLAFLATGVVVVIGRRRQ